MPSQLEQRRNYVVAEAVRAGKFTETRAAHYRKLYDRDPGGTEQLLAVLASGGPGEQPYPPELFPELAPRAAQRSSRPSRDGQRVGAAQTARLRGPESPLVAGAIKRAQIAWCQGAQCRDAADGH